MNWSLLVGLVSAAAALTPALAMAHGDGHDHVFPERNDDAATRAASWQVEAGWQISPPEQPAAGGTRVAAIFSVRGKQHVPLEARGVMADAAGNCTGSGKAGPWMVMEETFTRDEVRVAVLDLDERYSCAQLRLRGSDSEIVDDLQWELLVPRYPDAGKNSREALAQGVSPVSNIGPELKQIGVITRAEWNARPTQCTAIENNWYRMAIHHTAGPQTAGGTVEGRLQSTQAYSMDSGTWCDIPYQMLVGFDGSLWEGRGLVLQSGATGGGNNSGNLAVCFIGCYHKPDSACVGGVGHDVTNAMMQRGQLMIQTLVRLYDISTSADNIRGHRDWPGNSTACPGSLLHPRLGELRADLAWFSGAETERSWGDDDLEVPVGQSRELWIELENTGGLPWEPGETFLAPTGPRDDDSPLHDASWPSAIRAATVASSVAPGEVGRFVFNVATNSNETIVQPFGLVHEGITWFADGPWGGGPEDDVAIVSVVGVGQGAGDEGDGGGSGGESGGPGGDPTDAGGSGEEPSDGTDGFESQGGLPPGYGDGDGGACACSSGSTPGAWGAAWLLLLATRRRRRQ